MILFKTILLTVLLTVGAAAFHYEVLIATSRLARPRQGRPTLLLVLLALVMAHTVEIGLFAAGYWAGDTLFGLGGFAGERLVAGMDYFYFASETFTSLGYGDIYPVGDLRMLAGANTLAGLLLLAWSGAFLFSLVEEWRGRGQPIASEAVL